MLRNLTIENYRSFRHFHVDNLARVNLIVGKNNSGKTNLLEAIHLLVNDGDPRILTELMYTRGIKKSLKRNSEIPDMGFYHVRTLFHGFGAGGMDNSIKIESDLVDDHHINLMVVNKGSQTLNVSITSDSYANRHKNNSTIINLTNGSIATKFDLKPIEISCLISTTSMDFIELADLWRNILFTPKDDQVLEALKIINPQVERIAFIYDRLTFNSGILVKIKNFPEPMPLENTGDGMRRILALAMALVTVENGYLLVDDIDSGLHYEVQAKMWQLIFQTAQRLNAQVFATTHSWDCVVAFQEALSQQEDPIIGQLFRLENAGEESRAVVYTPDELAVVVRQSIEVR